MDRPAAHQTGLPIIPSPEVIIPETSMPRSLPTRIPQVVLVIFSLGALLLSTGAGAAAPLGDVPSVAIPHAHQTAPTGVSSDAPSLPTGSLSVALTATPDLGPAPLTANFTATVTGGSGPYTFYWALANDYTGTYTETSVGPSPGTASCAYWGAGSTLVWVAVNDSQGDHGIASTVVTVDSTTRTTNTTTTPPPSLDLNVSVSSFQGSWPFQENFSVSSTGGDGPVNYSWNFGEGLWDPQVPAPGATGANVSHTFVFPRNYEVLLYANDSRGDWGSMELLIQVLPALHGEEPFQVLLSASGIVARNGVVTTNYTSQVLGGTPPYTYAWSFGDGATSTAADPTETSSTCGTYVTRLVVVDAVGSSSLVMAPADQDLCSGSQPPPTLAVDATPLSGPAPLAVAFASAPLSLAGPPTPTKWWFGDGTNATGFTIAHTFASPGVYDILAATGDPGNETAWSAFTINVTASGAGNPYGGLEVAVSATGLAGPSPLSVDLATSVSGGTSPYTLSWSWGDGTSSSTDAGTAALHTFDAAGSYDPQLTVTEGSGAKVTWTFPPNLVKSGVVMVTPGKTSPPHGTPPAPVDPWLLPSVIVLGAGVAVAIALVARVRGRTAANVSRGPSPTAPSGPSPRPARPGEEETPDPVGYVW